MWCAGIRTGGCEFAGVGTGASDYSVLSVRGSQCAGCA